MPAPARLGRLSWVPLVLSLSLLTACGGDTDDDGGSSPDASETVTVTASPEPEATATPTQSPEASQPAEPERVRGLPPRPGPDSCVDVRVRKDGKYTVYEAGTAVVRRGGTRLVVGKVTPAKGWTSRVDDRDDDEVEIEFRKSRNNELDLEVELDDGRVEVQICADDD